MPENAEVYDPNDMMHETGHMVRDLEVSLKQDLHLNHMEFNKIVICGMGGSAIGGDIVADALYSVSKILVMVIRFSELPGWIDSDTLAIISSHSGNTMETLSAFDQAIARGCPVIGITSGGTLQEKCMALNVPMIKIKEGIQPRNAVGYTVGYLINAIASVGGPDIRADCLKTIPSLDKYLKELTPMDSLPNKLAHEIFGHLPIIYSLPEMYAIAGRWRAQFNENAKFIAFDGHLPDTNHNDIIGLMGDYKRAVKPIILVDKHQSRMMKDIISSTLSTLESRGLKPIVITMTGRNTFERTFKTMLLGDFISLHLAFFQSKDPSDVSSIKSLKSAVSKKLFRKRKSRKQ